MSNSEGKKPIQLPVSRWHSDNLGDLLADGTVDIDELCDQAVIDEERKAAWLEEQRAFEEWLEQNPPPEGSSFNNDDF